MLTALLNYCSPEELDRADVIGKKRPVSPGDEHKQVIRSKILAVGRMSRVFALLREESECVTELQNVSRGALLPPGALTFGSEGIKDTISTFEDARKSDIRNERLPPELVDPDDPAAFELLNSPLSEHDDWPPSPQEADTPTGSLTPEPYTLPIGGNESSSGLSSVLSSLVFPGYDTMSAMSPGFQRGHWRARSLGTTMTSPSMRRRSIESTMSLIKGTMNGTGIKRRISLIKWEMDGTRSNPDMSALANSVARVSRGQDSTVGTNNAPP